MTGPDGRKMRLGDPSTPQPPADAVRPDAPDLDELLEAEACEFITDHVLEKDTVFFEG